MGGLDVIAAAVMFAAALSIALASWMWQRRQQSAPLATPQDASGSVLPTHLTRSDFVAPESAWLIVAFSSATCLACAEVWQQIQGFESGTVAIADIEYGAEPKLHKTYRIDSVPTTVVVDQQGAVAAGFVGPLSPSALDDIATLVA